MSDINPGPTTTDEANLQRRRTWMWYAAALLICAVVTFALAALITTMFDRKQEAKNPYVRIVEVDDNTTDPAVWGTIGRSSSTPTRARSTRRTRATGAATARPPESRLEADPWLKRMFAGYAFAIDFRERRGHGYMLSDQRATLRVQQRPQAGACLNCHSSVVPTYRRIGLESVGKTLADAQGFDWPAVSSGFEKLSVMTYVNAHAELLKTPDGSPNEVTPLPGGSSIAVDTPANALGPRQDIPTTREALEAQVGEAPPRLLRRLS